LKTVADSRFDMDSLNTNTKTKAIAAFHDFYTPTTPSSPLPNMNSKEIYLIIESIKGYWYSFIA
jgi:hypothetical protein